MLGPGKWLRDLKTAVFSKYLAASGVALLVDLALFVQLIAINITPATASAFAYTVGIVVHWTLSRRAVFVGRVLKRSAARTAQKAQFFVSALIGLGITTGVVAGGSYLELDPRLAKLMAVAISFLTVWHIRNRFIFRSEDRNAVPL